MEMTVCNMAMLAAGLGFLFLLGGKWAMSNLNRYSKVRVDTGWRVGAVSLIPACGLILALSVGGIKPIHCGREDAVSRALKINPAVVIAGIPCDCTK